MLYLKLEIEGRAPAEQGPLEMLRLEPTALLLPDGRALAALVGGTWQVEGQPVCRLSIVPLAEVQFEGPRGNSVGHGPFAELRLDGEKLYADDRAEPLAVLSEGSLLDEHGRRWHAALITPSSSAHG